MTIQKELPGRNETCICGSGKKFKKCHWPQEMAKRAIEAKEEMAREEEMRRHEQSAPPFSLPPQLALSRKPPSEIFARLLPRLRDPALIRRAEEAERSLDVKGLQWREPGFRDELALDFEDACHQRWHNFSSTEDGLVTASNALFEADSERFKNEAGREGFEERRDALAMPLDELKRAGERAVPYLGVCLMSDSWASILAVESLAEMAGGPLRDRAIVEGLFAPTDWVPNASSMEVESWPAQRAWQPFEAVARWAADEGVELGSTYWTALFDRQSPNGGDHGYLTEDFGRAAKLLYDLGHHAALANVFSMWLDPFMDGEEGVRRFLENPAVQDALTHIQHAPAVAAVSERPPDYAALFEVIAPRLSQPLSLASPAP